MDRKQNNHMSTCGSSEETTTQVLSFLLCSTEQSDAPYATAADLF